MCSSFPASGSDRADRTDRVLDIESISDKFDAHIAKKFPKPNDADVIKYVPMIDSLLKGVSFARLKKIYSYSHKNSFLYTIFLIIYHSEQKYNEEDHRKMKDILKIKPGRSHSGILSITIFTSPEPSYINACGETVKQSFSCAFNCSYCPNEPGQPRSYLKGEPGVLRANREEFDCVRQMYIRMEALYLTGHDIDKLEILVLGGTWTSYPIEYREEYIRDIYYAANTFTDHIKNVVLGNIENNKWIAEIIIRDRESLEYEKYINKSATCKVIGLTLETRPDTINSEEIIRFRRYGCTRVQLGIQHLDDTILNTINRRCPTVITIAAIKMLKNCGYKIDAHFMPNLPGSDIKKDEYMFDKLLGVYSKKYKYNYKYNYTYPSTRGDSKDIVAYEKWDLRYCEFQVDQWKIYPTTITPFTEIQKWYHEGTYIPYSNDDLFNLLYKVKSIIFPWIRLNRCIRDICGDYVAQEDYHSNMRQYIQEEMQSSGISCQCIRCREVKNGIEYNEDSTIIVVREYNASFDTEYFISCETPDKKTLYGFTRLRLVRKINQMHKIFPELEDAALIRELHVYSEMRPVSIGSGGSVTSCLKSNQHRGIGKKLMAKAEEIAIQCGYPKISVISGQGAKGYYEKLGYNNNEGKGDFMIKNLIKNKTISRA